MPSNHKNTDINTVYLALYNPDINESAYCTISVHRTKKGAERAMEWHKNETIEEEREMTGDKDWIDESKRWDIKEIDLSE